MFADPITITIAGNDIDLTRVNQDQYSSEYWALDGLKSYQFKIKNTDYTRKTGEKVFRHNAELIVVKHNEDPSIPPITRKQYVVFEREANETSANTVATMLGFAAFLDTANVTKMVNRES